MARHLPEPRRSRSTLSKLDDLLLVVVVGAVALLALQIIGWVVGTIFFLVRLALVVLVVGLVAAWIARRR